MLNHRFWNDTWSIKKTKRWEKIDRYEESNITPCFRGGAVFAKPSKKKSFQISVELEMGGLWELFLFPEKYRLRIYGIHKEINGSGFKYFAEWALGAVCWEGAHGRPLAGTAQWPRRENKFKISQPHSQKIAETNWSAENWKLKLLLSRHNSGFSWPHLVHIFWSPWTNNFQRFAASEIGNQIWYSGPILKQSNSRSVDHEIPPKNTDVKTINTLIFPNPHE